jgi:hypothetical protein
MQSESVKKLIPEVRVEHSRPLPRNRGPGTEAYTLTEAEKTATKDWSPAELSSVGRKGMRRAVDARVAWFGIIRDVKEDQDADTTTLLVEMKYFDGFTDRHLQIVSIYGAGDFTARIPGTGYKLKMLSLVRVYGKVTVEHKGIPEVAADFVRSWNWKLLSFMPYGTDHSNQKWAKLRNIIDDRNVYDSNPNEAYYEKLLGKRPAE